MTGDTGTPQAYFLALLDDDLLDRVHEAFVAFGATLGSVAAADAALLELAVVELAGNALQHGNTAGRGSGSGLARLTLRCEDDDLVAEFCDTGERADHLVPGAVEMPPPDAESGRGLVLVASVTDGVRCDWEAGWNHWHLRRRSQVAGGPATAGA